MLTGKMMTPKYFALFFTFLVFSTVNAEETSIRSSAGSEAAQPVQRRYSEATLASDYSRSVDNMLKKDFVNWLLGRRMKKSDNILDAAKRQADFQLQDFNMVRDTMEETDGNKDFTTRLLDHNQISSFYDDTKLALCQEIVSLLIEKDLCKDRFL
ncbi:gastric inhibitory polypeptide [Hyperolius riggenbachi]|uniref:gastric inhibitory polypeptide n=1 Tax=Hyperolius riggenbachi TaxID=752182 RepID=UPI0035A2E16B